MIKRLLQISAALAAVAAISGTLWATSDYLGVRPVIKREFQEAMNQLQQNSEAILRIQFENLMAKRKYGELSFDEQQDLCRIAKALKYVGVPGC